MAAIETHALEKHYLVGFWKKKRKDALRPLDLTVNKGEVFGFLGPNGAGKTTTLRLLMGLVHPSGGSAKLLGCELDDPAMKRRIGFLPEQPYFYDHLTPRELLRYYAQLSDVPAREITRRSEQALARVGMAKSGDVRMRKLSKGMLQRVGVAQAIVHDPELLIFDEPQSGLDPIGRREIRDLMLELNAEGKTIFFSTHILSDAETVCDRVAVIHEGRLRAVGVVADLTKKQTGRVEIVWEGAQAAAAIAALGGKIHATGETRRAELDAARRDAGIDAIRAAGARLISVAPVQSTLEDFFMERLNAEAKAQ